MLALLCRCHVLCRLILRELPHPPPVSYPGDSLITTKQTQAFRNAYQRRLFNPFAPIVTQTTETYDPVPIQYRKEQRMPGTEFIRPANLSVIPSNHSAVTPRREIRVVKCVTFSCWKHRPAIPFLHALSRHCRLPLLGPDRRCSLLGRDLGLHLPSRREDHLIPSLLQQRLPLVLAVAPCLLATGPPRCPIPLLLLLLDLIF